MMRVAARLLLARVAIFFALFGAVSPALAAWQFKDRPDLLADLCLTAGVNRSVAGDNAPADEHEEISHAVLCVLCVPAAQHGAVGPITALVSFGTGLFELPVTRGFNALPVSPAASYLSRAPPPFQA